MRIVILHDIIRKKDDTVITKLINYTKIIQLINHTNINNDKLAMMKLDENKHMYSDQYYKNTIIKYIYMYILM